jgi:hypothetical protein
MTGDEPRDMSVRRMFSMYFSTPPNLTLAVDLTSLAFGSPPPLHILETSRLYPGSTSVSCVA